MAAVIGGASGIGLAAARTLARNGATVILADIDEPAARARAAGIAADGDHAVAVHVNIADEASVAALYTQIVDRFGQVNVVHNSAALTDPAHQARDGAICDLDATTFSRTLEVDLLGTMLSCKHAVPHLIAAGGGSIINTSSNSALAGDLSLTGYAAAKAGVNSLTASVATAYGKQGVRCNAISPSGILSPSLAANVRPAVIRMLEEQCLLPTLGTPQDVADLVLFLASDESRFITGQVIRIDGGTLSHLPHVAALRAGGATTADLGTSPPESG